MMVMNELITETENAAAAAQAKKRMSLGLQSRLLYLLLKCPLLRQEGQGCDCHEKNVRVAGAAARSRRVHADDEEVVLQVTVPYALRRAARAAHLDCNALARKTLLRQLKKAARK